jgi:ribosome-binding factor A
MSGALRPERVAEEFREILAEKIGRLKDPRVGFVTITRVEVPPDLRKAVVYYTSMGDERARRGTEAGLRSARAHLRTELGHQVRLKFTPDLEFREDVAVSQVERITELLRRIESEHPAGGGEDG